MSDCANKELVAKWPTTIILFKYDIKHLDNIEEKIYENIKI